MTARTNGTVRVVGSGLLGASIGHALSVLGVDVALTDLSKSALALAIDYGAGRAARDGDAPRLVVVAVPPDAVAEVVARELAAHPDAIVTDVASVKAGIVAELRELGADLRRYVGSHPMAGRERGGAVSARADLFVGRPWVVAAPPEAGPAAVHAVEDLARDLGALTVELDAPRHDAAVALVSHVPQLVASLLAKRLVGAPEEAVGLAGQGLRDTTRIAASDPALWVEILGANAAEVRPVLAALREDLDAALGALDAIDAPGARRAIAGVIADGAAGVARLPGKHGVSRHYATITVIVDDRPGEIARLLTEIGSLGVNMEDLRLEHSPGAQVGMAEIAVLPEVEARLVAALEASGWRIGGAE